MSFSSNNSPSTSTASRFAHIGAIALMAMVAHAPSAHAQAVAGTVDLLPTPPEITASVAPNIVVTFDDSGSMGFHFMPDEVPFYNRRWHNTTGGVTGLGIRDDQSVYANNTYNYSAIPYLCAAVIDPSVTDPANARSFSINGVYYNPNIVYQVPLKNDGVTPFPTPSFRNAWNNGIRRNRPDSPASAASNVIISTADTNRNKDGNRDLATANFCGQTGAGYFKLKAGVALTVNAQRIITNPADLYLPANWEWVPLPASQQTNFAIWWSYYHTRYLAQVSALSRAFAPFDDGVRVAFQNMNNNRLDSATTIDSFQGAVRNAFYKELFASPVGGGTPTLTSTIRVGEFFTRSGSNLTNPYWDPNAGPNGNGMELSCRQNFHFLTTDGFWNQTPPGSLSPQDHITQALPDGRSLTVGDAESKIFWNDADTSTVTLADIAWKYWATDLRTLDDRVPTFIPDRSTDLFAPFTLPAAANPLSDKEIYWNPANNPATWQHMVNFMISFGADGDIPQNDTNYRSLRSGALSWPRTAANTTPNVDDLWHAALNSRGQAFSASNPNELIAAMTRIVSNILSRRGSSTAASVSLPIITDGTSGYSAGYDTSDWSGSVTRVNLDPETGARLGVRWDAGCILTGGNCASTNQSGLPVRDPDSRVIFTADGLPGTGRAFRYGDLSTQQKLRLNVDPSTIRLDLGTWAIDTAGPQRVDYIRGVRTNETTGTPLMRVRNSVLGSVIRGQPVYVSSPTTGYDDIFPDGSPEAIAQSAGYSYAAFQNQYVNRRPTLYVAANDGMLHAFDAANGSELFAYVPNAVIENFRLTKGTEFESGFTPSVDDKPVTGDAFINGSWKTLLLGSLRLGGRGIYALDITRATEPSTATESSEKVKALWEFTNVPPAGVVSADCTPGGRHCTSLGYTYESVNVARIKYQDKWVALVSSGYFPKDALDPASRETAASRTSLLIIDLATGTLIKEIRTSTAPQSAIASFGLSQPIPYDFGGDQVSEVVVAGDLAGNLWRFDLSSDNPANWKVDLMFRSYGNGGAAATGDQPISSGAVAMSDPLTRGPIWVFGTGKYIGLPDRTPTIPEQAFYGIRDYGTCDASNPTACARYPIQVGQLVDQTLVQDGSGVRKITTSNTVPDTKRGWRIRLNLSQELGERSFTIPFAFFSTNQVLLRTIIPKGVDPCDPGARYGLMVVRASDGTATVDPNDPAPSREVGGVLGSSTPPGNPVTVRGGGRTIIPGVPPPEDCAPNCSAATLALNRVINALSTALSAANPPWHRGAWREILDQ
jgi:type IV pilus assembly protein PilY1